MYHYYHDVSLAQISLPTITTCPYCQSLLVGLLCYILYYYRAVVAHPYEGVQRSTSLMNSLILFR